MGHYLMFALTSPHRSLSFGHRKSLDFFQAWHFRAKENSHSRWAPTRLASTRASRPRCMLEWVLGLPSTGLDFVPHDDVRRGWGDLLASIRNANLLQVLLATIPDTACSLPQEAPLWGGRGTKLPPPPLPHQTPSLTLLLLWGSPMILHPFLPLDLVLFSPKVHCTSGHISMSEAESYGAVMNAWCIWYLRYIWLKVHAVKL